MNNKLCSEHYIIEPKEGVLQYCPQHENADQIAEGLRAIAGLRTTTTVLIQNVCEAHKDPVTKWNEAMQRVRANGHHVMGDMLEGCFDELNEEPSNIIQFPKK